MKVALKKIASLRSGGSGEPGSSGTGARPQPATRVVDSGWNIREMLAELFDNANFTATFLVASGATLLLVISWIYRNITHDPHLDPSSGGDILLVLLVLGGLVLFRVIVIFRRKMHGR